ncbi:hypothetical protein PVAND_009736 [Polypedilum vanderplanki]|uniref:Tetratricopeptide repeat protein 28 n=1 Tax=Polypedilum vanderplanki TaxID=319348 RepID=A0A9J6CEK4_POLVA|nr:hypothetical protein PVAND_009736 [Polypedilum vanderplanki]
MSENETCTTSNLPEANRILFLDKVRLSATACQNGDFATAVQLYTDALLLDPTNHILYSNRSAARLKQGQFLLALQDATKARELCPQWPKAYFRQGVALQCLGRYAEALAAFSSGLAQDPNSKQLLSGLIEASIKSPLRSALEPTFEQLKNMNLDQSPFVVISVIGQELLSGAHYHSALTVLEAALKIGSCSLKLRGSVFSALSSAYWALNQLDKAISYMQQDLAVAKSLGDQLGECRAHGNLGSAYFSQGSFKEALTAHRYQLVLAMKCKDTQSASIALTSLGHVYTAIGDYPNALASHKQCVQLVKQMGNLLQEAREIGNVGAVYLAMGEFDLAIDCHQQHLRLAKKVNNMVEMAKAYSNLGSSYHYKRNFSQAIIYHENVLKIASQLNDRALETRFLYRAYAGLGHAARCGGDYSQAKKWHEKQLEMALAARDKIGEGRSISNLGIVYQLLGENDHALKLHQAHLAISRQLQDKAGMGRAFGNIANSYYAVGYYEQAIKYHKQELIISKEVGDRSAEASTHGNLAVAYQAIGAHAMALIHYRSHLNIARELKDTVGESCALLNLGNCLSSRQEFAEAVQYYEQYLMLSQEFGDVSAEGKACHFLGYVHYCLGNYREAVRYYDQDLALAKDLQNKVNMGRAYCNVGLCHLALGNNEEALECQKYFLAIAHMTNNNNGKFRALGNIGDVLIKMNDLDEASKMFQRQLQIARQLRDRNLEASACGSLGLVNRLMKKFDKALGFHTQELTLRQEMTDILGESRCHQSLGAVHMAIGNFIHALKCYQEQLERAQELKDMAQISNAFGNLGIARLNMGHYEEAIGFLEQQLGTLEQVNNTPQVLHDKARSLGNLGDCYNAIGDHEEAIKCHEQHLQLAVQLSSLRDQERAFRGIGISHKQMGNFQEALVCLEKRLFVAHELGSLEAKACSYSDLSSIHCALKNYEQAVACLEHQRDIARELDDRTMTSDAISSLGVVFLQMGDYDGALRLHKMDLELCENIGTNNNITARAYGNLASVYEALKNTHEAVKCLEKQLSLTNDRLTKSLCFMNLGRVLQSMNQTTRAIDCLQQALQIAQSLNKNEEESKIRYCLSLSLLASNDKEEARSQIEHATQILESIRLADQRSLQSRNELYALQTQCYQTLTHILVELGKEEDALITAEKCRARIISDGMKNSPTMPLSNRKLLFTCSDYLFDSVDKFKTHIIYYAIANDELYAWYLQPQKKIVRFHIAKLIESILVLPPSQKTKNETISGAKLLERYISFVRDSLGVYCADEIASQVNNNNNTGQWRSSSSENLIDDFANERQGFLRMVNRNHLLNSSNYSLSSLFSLGSISSLQGSTRSIGSFNPNNSTRSRSSAIQSNSTTWQGPTCLHVLYNLLLAPFEDLLPTCGSSPKTGRRELILVLEDVLYLVPFAILRSADEHGEFLSERCSLLTVPSIQALRQRHRFKNREAMENNKALVVGVGVNRNHPELSCGNYDPTAAVQEAAMISEILHTKPLIQQAASKETVMNDLTNAECIHFACQLAWKHSAVVLSPGNMVESQSNSKRYYPNSSSNDIDQEDEGNDINNSAMEIPLNDFILSGSEIANMRLAAKLVVFNTNSTSDQISGSAVAKFTNSWLIAGTGAVLISLWPVPEMASKILLRAFYSALLQGSKVANALTEAMQTVQHTKHFNNPVNWAGFMVVGGANIRLSNKVVLIGQALCELLKQPEKCRDALRVCLHLVEKSLQRIHRGQKNAMYTTQKSIENKAGVVTGWKDLLIACGFRFEPAANGIPSSVFFPQSDPEERLSQCSASLQAILALTSTTLHALSKLVTNNSESSDDIISVMRNIVAQFQSKTTNDSEGIEVSLSVRLWKISGFHEMLASLGFDLMDVGQDQVTLRTGKHANKRNCQFVLQALLALFTQEAPKTIGMDSSSNTSSSTESLNDAIENEKAAANVPYNNFPRPLAAPRKMMTSSRSAFISYQKRRGEPDGGHEEVSTVQQTKLQPTFENTDSELSDGYATQKILAKYSDLNYGAIKGNPKITRQGGGRESDANFTPSPIENNVSMALAHQTRIRNLYTNISEATGSGIVMTKNGNRRPDSSSSASSTAEQNWDSGHQTVLRRANNSTNATTLPMPATRQHLPIVDPLRPTAPVYNNLMMHSGMKKALMMESTSSDSESNWVPNQTRTKIKLHQQFIQQAHQQHHQMVSHYQDMPLVNVAKLKEQFNFNDRLSVRTEAAKSSGHKKSMIKTNDDALNLTGNSLYFSPAELQNTTTNLVEEDAGPSSMHHTTTHHTHHKPSKENKGGNTTVTTAVINSAPTKKNIQDSILRHMSREMAPTISELFHERNIGLISAPPLSKLLMTNYEENETQAISQAPTTSSASPTSGLNKLMNAIDLSEEITNCTPSTAKVSALLSCGGASNSDEEYSIEDEGTSSQATTMKSVPTKKSFNSVPWLSSINTENIVKPSDLTTADILEHQKIKSTSSSSSNSDHLSIIKSPYNEFRDDADGNSQSSTPKNSLPSKQKGKGSLY